MPPPIPPLTVRCGSSLPTAQCPPCCAPKWAFCESPGSSAIGPSWPLSRPKSAKTKSSEFLKFFVFADIRWAHVNFGDHNHHGNVQGKGQHQVLFRRADDARVGADHQHWVIRLKPIKFPKIIHPSFLSYFLPHQPCVRSCRKWLSSNISRARPNRWMWPPKNKNSQNPNKCFCSFHAFADSLQMSIQSKWPLCVFGRLVTSPAIEKPKMSLPTDDVRPDSNSCLCLNYLLSFLFTSLTPHNCCST